MDGSDNRKVPRGWPAQGATEYLILLGAVLVIALIAIGILNMIPNSSADIRSSVSDSYWSASTPFTIYRHSMTTDGLLTMTVFNRGAKPLTLQGVQVSGDGASSQQSSAIELLPGKQTEVKIPLNIDCPPNGVYAWMVNISYGDSDSQLPDQELVGKEPIVGHCVGLAGEPPQPDCGGLLCNGESCSNPNQCQSHHCHDFGGGKKCVQCIGNGHCSGGQQCVQGVCVSE